MSSEFTPKTAAETIRLLARAVNEHFPDDLLKKLHIKTPVEEEIIFNAQKKHVVIVTGNPGDGKTHLIRRAKTEFPNKTKIVPDGNELESDEIVKLIQGAISDRLPLVMAINEGILLQACHPVEPRYTWARDIVGSLLHPYRYESRKEEKSGAEKIGVVVFDLTHRNNLAGEVVEDVLDNITALAISEATPMSANARRLQDTTVKKRLCRLLDRVARTGFHATMRDLLGFLAHLLCGGEDEIDGTQPSPYYVNSFRDGEGPLSELNCMSVGQSENSEYVGLVQVRGVRTEKQEGFLRHGIFSSCFIQE